MTPQRPDKPLNPTELKRLHRTWRKSTTSRLALILDGVQNPFNVGSIMRSAAAYRVEHLWLAKPTVELPHAKVSKTALGCDRLVTATVVDDACTAVAAAKAAGFQTVAVELTGSAKPLFSIPMQGDVCLVVGHEERGVKKETLAVVDAVGFAPLVGKVGSLNVATATSIALYEAARQGWSSES